LASDFVREDFGGTTHFPFDVNRIVVPPTSNWETQKSKEPWHDELGKYVAQVYEMFLLKQDQTRAMHRFYYLEYNYNPSLMELEHISPQMPRASIARLPTIGNYVADPPDDKYRKFTALQIEWSNVYNSGLLCLLHESINGSIGDSDGAAECQLHFSINPQDNHAAAALRPILYRPENPTPV